jgi:hypothetical protein
VCPTRRERAYTRLRAGAGATARPGAVDLSARGASAAMVEHDKDMMFDVAHTAHDVDLSAWSHAHRTVLLRPAHAFHRAARTHTDQLPRRAGEARRGASRGEAGVHATGGGRSCRRRSGGGDGDHACVACARRRSVRGPAIAFPLHVGQCHPGLCGCGKGQ